MEELCRKLQNKLEKTIAYKSMGKKSLKDCLRHSETGCPVYWDSTLQKFGFTGLFAYWQDPHGVIQGAAYAEEKVYLQEEEVEKILQWFTNEYR
jgi:hypothetical protein